MFTSLEEVKLYIEECEQKRYDLENVELWSKVCLPTARTTVVKSNYQDKGMLENVQMRFVASNESLLVVNHCQIG